MVLQLEQELDEAIANAAATTKDTTTASVTSVISSTIAGGSTDGNNGMCFVHSQHRSKRTRARALMAASQANHALPTPATDLNNLLSQLFADPLTNTSSIHTLCQARRAYLEHLATTDTEAAVLEAASLDPWRELLSPWLPMDCMETMYDGEAMVTTLRVKPTPESMGLPPTHRGLCGPYQQQSIQIDAGTLELATSGPGWVGACDGESTIPPV